MSDKLTERERWLMTEAFMRGYEWGHLKAVEKWRGGHSEAVAGESL